MKGFLFLCVALVAVSILVPDEAQAGGRSRSVVVQKNIVRGGRVANVQVVRGFDFVQPAFVQKQVIVNRGFGVRSANVNVFRSRGFVQPLYVQPQAVFVPQSFVPLDDGCGHFGSSGFSSSASFFSY